MKKMLLPILFVSLFLLSLLGCAQWEEAVLHADAVDHAGKTAIDIGTATSMFNPAIGVWIIAIGGIVSALSKILLLSKKKENV